RPSLRKANITWFLSCQINHRFDERLEFFWTLFMSRDVLAKDILRNPSPLTYNFHNTIKPAILPYEDIMRVSRYRTGIPNDEGIEERHLPTRCSFFRP
ncbi:hypothetical protein SO802_010913, partial [Lithocarpus litseifolius]